MSHQNLFSTREAYNEFRAEHRTHAALKQLTFDDCLAFRAYMGKPLASAVAPNSNPYLLSYAMKRVLARIERDKREGLDDEKRDQFLKIAKRYCYGPQLQQQDIQAADIELKLERKTVQQEETMA